MSGEERKQILAAATAEWIEWPESLRRAFFFFFFLSACWGYLCIYDFLEETGGSALALCVCQTEREAKRVSMWVSPLATYWADEVFWTEKEEFPRTWEGIHRRLLRKFGLNSGSSPQWISFLWSRRILELLQTLDAGPLPCSLIVWTRFPVGFLSALLQSFLLLCLVLVASSHRDERSPLAPALCDLEELDVQPGASRRARCRFPNRAGWNRRQHNPG